MINLLTISKTATITTIITRVLGLSFYYLSDYGKTSLWNNWFFNTFDHYQLGILILVVSHRTRSKLKHLLIGVGLGLLIDEAGQLVNIISLNKVTVEYNSITDWTMLLSSLFIFLLLLKIKPFVNW